MESRDTEKSPTNFAIRGTLQQPARLQFWLSQRLRFVVWLSFIVVGFLTFFYIAWVHTSAIGWPVAALLCGILATWGLASSNRLDNWLAKPNGFLDGQHTLVYVFLGGIGLRLIWYAFVPPVFFSDTLIYWSSAIQLVETGKFAFVDNDGYTLLAWRPPGYAFVLAAWIAVFGQKPWIPALIALCSYAATFFAVQALATMIASARAARVASAIVAFWPSAIAISVNANTDPLSLLLVTVAVFAFLRSVDSGPGWAVLAGLATGYGALVQPTLLTLPALWCVYALLEPARTRRILGRSAIGILLAATVVAPWTLRNYRHLGAFIPVSSNGGDVFYRANNPKADGGFTAEGERNLGLLKDDEVTWNRTGFKWGLEWITGNPMAFLRMIPRKQGLLLGEDAYGVFYTLNWPTPAQGYVYPVLVVIANMWWLGVWMAALIGLLRLRRGAVNNPRLSLILLVFLSVVATHSIFESQSRHHMRVSGLLAVVCALAFVPKSQTGGDSELASTPPLA